MSILKPYFYKQADSRWAKKKYKCTDGGYASVGTAGCGPTSVANVVSALIKPIRPYTVFKYACQKGYMTSNSGMYRSAIPKLLKHYNIDPVEILPRNSEGKKKLKSYLKKNYWAIAIMGPGIWTRGGHYILAYYVDSNNRVYISDSASSAEYRQKNTFENFWDQQKDVSWLVVNPKKYVSKTITNTSSVAKSYTLYTNNNKANIRKGRGTKYDIVATIKKRNKTVKVKNLKNGWWQIASGIYKGKYISENNLSKYKTQTITYQTLYTMNVREGYTTSSKIISKVNKGKTIKSTKQKGNWAYVPSKKGWVCIKDSNKTYLKKV